MPPVPSPPLQVPVISLLNTIHNYTQQLSSHTVEPICSPTNNFQSTSQLFISTRQPLGRATADARVKGPSAELPELAAVGQNIATVYSWPAASSSAVLFSVFLVHSTLCFLQSSSNRVGPERRWGWGCGGLQGFRKHAHHHLKK